MPELHHFFHRLLGRHVLMALGAFSIVAAIASAILVPVVLVRLRPDYFLRPRERRVTHPVVLAARNLLGGVLVLLGAALLVLPGQGVITILLGLGLLDFPGRRRVELFVLGKPGVLKTINVLRRRYDRAPLEIPPAP